MFNVAPLMLHVILVLQCVGQASMNMNHVLVIVRAA